MRFFLKEHSGNLKQEDFCMKLASLKDGTRDGKLLIVSDDLKHCVHPVEIAMTLQEALDRWLEVEEPLKTLAKDLNAGRVKNCFSFDETKMHSPLPRAYQWADGSAYLSHMRLVRKARGAEMPESFNEIPLMYQGGSDSFLGPYEGIPLANPEWGLDFEAEIAVVTDDVPMGVTKEEAKDHIKLVMLCNDVSLRMVMKPELARGFGFFQSKPSSAFSPVCVTPDSLGDLWDGGKIHLPLISHLNGKKVGSPDAGKDLYFDFPALISHAARTRPLVAGSIIGSGTVSNENYKEVGSSCLAEIRMIETIEEGAPKTPFMQVGDEVHIEMLDKNNKSIFGSIKQKVEKL